MFGSMRAPETMTAAEQARILKVTAAHDDPRDHVQYSMALGTGLRLRELLGQLPEFLIGQPRRQGVGRRARERRTRQQAGDAHQQEDKGT